MRDYSREGTGYDRGWRFVANAFCPTGKGGGQDNSCGPAGPKALAAEFVRLHNEASREFAAAFKAVGARMWQKDKAHPFKTENQKFIAEVMADYLRPGGPGVKEVAGVYGITRPLTVLDSHPQVRADPAKVRTLKAAVDEIHGRYTAAWKKALSGYRPAARGGGQ
jgi:hypothetical protein